MPASAIYKEMSIHTYTYIYLYTYIHIDYISTRCSAGLTLEHVSLGGHLRLTKLELAREKADRKQRDDEEMYIHIHIYTSHTIRVNLGPSLRAYQPPPAPPADET